MEDDQSGKIDSQFVLKLGIFTCILITLSGFFISFLGGVFVLLLILGTSYLTSSFALRQKPIGNLLRSYVPPRTNWCTKMEFDHVLIPPDVDEALERLYERIISEHIESWYRELSLDEEFLQELRYIFREATSEILVRLTRIDLTETLINDVIPISLQHLDAYLWSIKHAGLQEDDLRSSGNPKLHSTWLEFMGKEVHPALANRDAETKYIEGLSEKLTPLIIKSKETNGRLASSLSIAILSHILLQPLLDLLCSPRVVNKLLLLWFSPDPIVSHPSSQDPPVRLLLRFVHASNHPKPSALHVDLSAILKDTSLLYPFLQYLKKNGGVNLLQFCLAVEDFNKKMMVVDLPDSKLMSLHKDAKNLYDSYIKVGADNFIKFEDDIIKEVGNIICQGHLHIQKLRTTPPLFRAYEQVYNNLEDNFCPHFHTSDEYLGLVLGPRLSETRESSNTKLETGSMPSPTPSAMKGKLAKMKTEVLGAGPLEGSPEPECDPAYDLSELGEDGDRGNEGEGEVRDLSAWRVNVPRLEARTVEGRACFTFVIQVQRIDVTSQTGGEDLEWTVDRQYHEFYSLQSALVQYHGLFEDAKLPPRAKLFGGRGLDVLQSKLEPFEDFLVRLLQKPNLKKSDLLFTFLTSKQEFNEAASQLRLSRIIKTVPNIIKKEKGQFLQSFISTFVSSTLSPSPRPGRLDAEDGGGIDKDKKDQIYKDNFSKSSSFTPATLGPTQTCTVSGLYDTLLYLALRLARLNEPWLRLLSGLKLVLAESFNHLVHYLLATKMDVLLTSGRVRLLIEAIEEAVFDPSPVVEDSKEDKKKRKDTLDSFRSYLPTLLSSFLGQSYNPSTELIHNCLQEPLLNKQLAYSLLGTLLIKLFPELRI